jgi:hypothetical protein
MKHWADVTISETPRKRAHGRRDRVRRKTEKEEEAPEVLDDCGGDAGGEEVAGAPAPPPVEGGLERGDHEGGGADEAAAACAECGGGLICPKCDDSIEIKARKVLKEIGDRFVSKASQNRVQAFEDYAVDLMSNQDVLVGSRIISLDSITRIVQGIHTMIGAPKKKEEHGQEDNALGFLAEWLGGGDVPAFAKVGEINIPTLELVTTVDEDEGEAENGG